jgi:hypothetical protein
MSLGSGVRRGWGPVCWKIGANCAYMYSAKKKQNKSTAVLMWIAFNGQCIRVFLDTTKIRSELAKYGNKFSAV